MLHISHSEDDLHLTGFTFDEVQVVSLDDDNIDLVPMSLINITTLWYLV